MGYRDALHQLIDELPEEDLSGLLQYARFVRTYREDPVFRALVSAPESDELPDPEEAESLAGPADATISHQELMRELGL